MEMNVEKDESLITIVGIVTLSEFGQLQEHLALHLQAVNLCAYQTAMRLGEILGLTWDRVEFKRGLIQLRAEDTKTNESRIIPVT